MVVSQKVFLRDADAERRVRRPALGVPDCSVDMDHLPPLRCGKLNLSYLVIKFYKNNRARVIIPVCEFLSPVVVLAISDNWVLPSTGICDTLTGRKKQELLKYADPKCTALYR